MKKLILFVLTLSLIGTRPTLLANAEIELDLLAPSAVLLEHTSGAVIYEKNGSEKMYPASMTKMMGMLLVLEHIENGKMSFTDEVMASQYSSSMGGTQIFLEPGEKMSVDDLFKSVAINSANDAMVTLAEAVAGSNAEFIKMMNERAAQLGLTNTNFVNATGFHDPNHYSSSLDMARLGRQLLLYHEQTITNYTKQYDGYIREDSPNPFWLVNTNKLVKYYTGMDGLKTGYTSDSGFCLTATAKRSNLRFIATVMKETSVANRSKDITTLLDYGFAKYTSLVVYHKNEEITKFTYNYGNGSDLSVITREEVRISVNKGDDISTLKIIFVITKKDAPVEANEVVGYLEIENKNGWVSRYDLISKEAVSKTTWFDMFIATLRQLLF